MSSRPKEKEDINCDGNERSATLEDKWKKKKVDYELEGIPEHFTWYAGSLKSRNFC